MEGNQEFEFFHHAPKLTLVASTIRAARAEVLRFFGEYFSKVDTPVNVLVRDGGSDRYPAKVALWNLRATVPNAVVTQKGTSSWSYGMRITTLCGKVSFP